MTSELPADGQPDFAGAVRRLQQQMPTEHMTAGREAALTAMLAKLEVAVSGSNGQAAAGQVGHLMAELAPMMFDPTRSESLHAPPAGSRQAVLLTFVKAMHDAAVREVVGLDWTISGTPEAATALLGGLRDVRERLLTAPDGEITGLEREFLRPLAQTARDLAARRHLAFARPVWSTTAVVRDASAVFVAGGDLVMGLSAEVAATRDLRVLGSVEHGEPASARWAQLREAAIGVFDMTAAGTSAAVSYELGTALAVGRPVVIVADVAQQLPFDVDVVPVRLAGAGDAEALAAAVDAVLYGVQRGDASSGGIGASLDWLRGYFVERVSPARMQVLDVFDDDAGVDPVQARTRAAYALSSLDSERPEILLPPWPAAYPDPERPRCFHVTPFRPDWAATTRELVATACGVEIAYRRGDEVVAPGIIQSIWDEIASATHVVVDLTGQNANVLLELGIAHVLGRNVRLISQDDTPEGLPPALAKIRCHRYSLTGAGPEELIRTLHDEFLHPDRPRALPATRSAERVSPVWTGLGKLWSTGVAYVQHVRFVDGARQLSADEVPAALERYLAGLSPAARTGFGLTLAMLGRREKSDPGRRAFVQALASAVAGGDVSLARAMAAPARPKATFDEDVDTLDTWLSLSGTERAGAVAAHVATLSVAGRVSFLDHVRQMAENVAAGIGEHDASEDEAWGSSVEDRIAYGMARLGTGRSDQRWLAKGEELRAWSSLIDEVIATAQNPPAAAR